MPRGAWPHGLAFFAPQAPAQAPGRAPCPLSARDKNFLDLYYKPVSQNAEKYNVDPALVLGLGAESGFANPKIKNSTHNRTGDAFGQTGGSTKNMTTAKNPTENANQWFNSWGSRVKDAGTNGELFIHDLEDEDAAGQRLNHHGQYNSYKGSSDWRDMARRGIRLMLKEVPIYIKHCINKGALMGRTKGDAMICLAWAAVLLGAIAMHAQAASPPKFYRNNEFGVRVPVPKEGFLCASPKDEHDHGFAILLGGGRSEDCRGDGRHRSVVLFAFYNVLEDDTEHLPGLLKMGCEGRQSGRGISGGCPSGPAGLEIPGLAIATGTVKSPDGWIDLVVVTQAGEPTADEPNKPLVNYIFSLCTRPEHLDEDLKVFRIILQTVKLPSARVKRR